MDGYLAKKGHIIPTWHLRYFCFDAIAKTLTYYNGAKSAAQRSSARDELTVTSVCDVPDRPGARMNRFDIMGFNHNKGNVVLSVNADSQLDKQRWIEAISAVVGQTDVVQHPRYQEFLHATGTHKESVAAADSRAGTTYSDVKCLGLRMVAVTVLAARGVMTHRNFEVCEELRALLRIAEASKDERQCREIRRALHRYERHSLARDARAPRMHCIIVPLTVTGDEIETEKRETRTSAELEWPNERFNLGYRTALESACVVLIKIKADDGKVDCGCVHIPLQPLLHPASPQYLAEATTQVHALEARKAMRGVQGELHVQLTPVVAPSVEKLKAVADAMIGGLDIRDRSIFLKLHRNCFLGQDAVAFLRSNSPVAGVSFVSDDDVLMFGHYMLQHKLFASVAPKGAPFANTYNFYRFCRHEPLPLGSDDGATAAVAAAAVPRSAATATVASPRSAATAAAVGVRRDFTMAAHVPAIAVQQQSSMSIDEFEVIKLLGTGAFGKVVLVRHTRTQQVFATKVLDKISMSPSDQVHTWTERTVLNKVVHPFIATLEFAFQSPTKLFMGMEFFSGGDLHTHIFNRARTTQQSHRRGLSVETTRFYAAEITSGIAHLHSLGVIYRDLKGENVMIARDGHIKLVDFGLAKLHVESREALSCVGTPIFVAPEVLASSKTKCGYGKACDWWTLGILIFSMLVGRPPFLGRTKQQLFWNIQNAALRLPDEMDDSAQGILRGLLERNPDWRFGTRGEVPRDIMEHEFFGAIDWDKLVAKELPPPWVPEPDRFYVDEQMQRDEDLDSICHTDVAAAVPRESDVFRGFSFVGDSVSGSNYEENMSGGALAGGSGVDASVGPSDSGRQEACGAGDSGLNITDGDAVDALAGAFANAGSTRDSFDISGEYEVLCEAHFSPKPLVTPAQEQKAALCGGRTSAESKAYSEAHSL